MRRDAFQAIADPIRRQIITLLKNRSLHLTEIASNFEISRPAISKHIKILNECGMVLYTIKGRKRFCRLAPNCLNTVAKWVDRNSELWHIKLESFSAYTGPLQDRSIKAERTKNESKKKKKKNKKSSKKKN